MDRIGDTIAAVRSQLLRHLSKRSFDESLYIDKVIDPEYTDTGDSMYHDIIYNDQGAVTESIRQIFSSIPSESRKPAMMYWLQERNHTDLTMLEVAIDRDKTRLIEFLLSQLTSAECFEIISNKHPKSGWTLLYRTVVKGKFNIAKLLLDAVDCNRLKELISIKSATGMTVLTKSLESLSAAKVILLALKPPQRIELLKERNSREGRTLIHKLAITGNSDVMKWILLNAQANIQNLFKALDAAGRNCLHLAVKVGDLGMMEIILKSLNRIDASYLALQLDLKGMSALHYASTHTNQKFSCRATRLLLNSVSQSLVPCLVSQRSKLNRTPFELAHRIGNVRAMQIIAQWLRKHPGIIFPVSSHLDSGVTPVEENSTDTIKVGVPTSDAETEKYSNMDDADTDINCQYDITFSADELMVDITESLNNWDLNQPASDGASCYLLSEITNGNKEHHLGHQNTGSDKRVQTTTSHNQQCQGGSQWLPPQTFETTDTNHIPLPQHRMDVLKRYLQSLPDQNDTGDDG